MSSPGSPEQPRQPDPPADDIEDSDPSLAGQRTMFAWTRTAMAFVALGAAVARLRPLAGIPILVIGVVLWPAARVRRFGIAAPGGRPLVRAVMAAVVTVAMLALFIALAGRGSAGYRL